MATKSANVTARVQPEIKRQAEAVLDKLGLPVSVLIDTLYRQIIDFGHILRYCEIRKKDNVKEGVPLPIEKAEH